MASLYILAPIRVSKLFYFEAFYVEVALPPMHPFIPGCMDGRDLLGF
jgi:hypothetical protein